MQGSWEVIRFDGCEDAGKEGSDRGMFAIGVGIHVLSVSFLPRPNGTGSEAFLV